MPTWIAAKQCERTPHPWPQSHAPCNRCVRFATTPVATQHSLPSGRYSLLGPDLPPAGSQQLCLAQLLDHLVGPTSFSLGARAAVPVGIRLPGVVDTHRLLGRWPALYRGPTRSWIRPVI
jgi:hypothetical protein